MRPDGSVLTRHLDEAPYATVAHDMWLSEAYVVMPFMPALAAVGFDQPDAGSDDPVEMYLSDIYTVPVNLAGNAAISVPCGTSPDDGPNTSSGKSRKTGPRWADDARCAASNTILPAVVGSVTVAADGLWRWPFQGGAAEQAYRDASPHFLVKDRPPPFLIIHGLRDTNQPIAHSRRMVEAATRWPSVSSSPWIRR